MQALQDSGLAGLVALALPILALITVMVIAVRQISKRRASNKVPLTGRYGARLPQARSTKPQIETLKEALSEQPATVRSANANEVASLIAAARSRGSEAELSGLYLALARDRLANDRLDEAGDLLRQSIRLAAKLGQKQTHADARLALGDLMREQGDLTTACEHWQIARGLLYELKNSGELAAAEKRMRQNGCPTDWVLNDF